MKSRLSIALPVFLVLWGCSEEFEKHDHPSAPVGEIRASEATELPDSTSEAETPDIKLREPVGYD